MSDAQTEMASTGPNGIRPTTTGATTVMPALIAESAPSGAAEPTPVAEPAKSRRSSRPDASSIQVDAKQPQASEQARAASVTDITFGAHDSGKREVQRVFYKFNDYAVFLSANEVRVHYSDVDATKNEQIGKIAELVAARQRLQYLADRPGLGARYHPQIADALFLALQDKKDCAKLVLDEALKDIQEIRAREGRMSYLKFAVGLGIGLSVPLFAFAQGFFDRAQMLPVLAAAGAGSIGALLSIAIALRGRTVAIDGDWQTNLVDVTIRLLIGVISAAALFLLLSSGMVPNVQLGEVKLAGSASNWQIALVIGFLAGFVERLLPDLLEKRPANPNK
jgi:hypothetical protein